MGHALPTIFFPSVFNDIRTTVVGKINIDIRRIDALRVEESLKEQSIAYGVDVADFQKVGDQRACGRTSGDTGDAFGAAVLDEVTDDQEVTDEPHLFDDTHFDVQAIDQYLQRLCDDRVFKRFSWIEPIQTGVRTFGLQSRQKGRVFHPQYLEGFPIHFHLQAIPFVKPLGQQMP